MRQLHFDLLRLLADDRQGSHGTRRGLRYILTHAAERSCSRHVNDACVDASGSCG